MPSKLEQCCGFVDSYKQITWTKTAMLICFAPFALVVLILVLLFMLSAPQVGAVVSNSLICSSIGKDVLEEGGSAVDAAIATMLCEGIAVPNSAGVGGGFTAVMYAYGKFDSIVATPTVPLAAQNITDFKEYTMDAKSVGVPGELLGYWEMHRRFGVLSWKRLIEPSIQLCEQGAPITEWLANILLVKKDQIANLTIFDASEANEFVTEKKIKHPILAKTLQRIANEGVRPFYKGDIGDKFIRDLRERGGILTKSDLENYRVIWDNHPPSTNIKNTFKLVTTPLPTSGALTVFVMNIIKNLNPKKYPLFLHQMIEAMKHAFGHSAYLGDADNDAVYRERILKVYNNLLDPEYAREIRELIKDDRVFADIAYYGSKYVPASTLGSANICVLSPRGDAVAATTSILGEFGSYFGSKRTGIIGNNLLAVFYRHRRNVSPMNRPLPGKHAFSSYSPAIVIRKRKAEPFFMVGSSGGPRAVTFVITAIMKYVLNGTSAEGASSARYLHNQLHPNRVEYEEEPVEEILKFLQKAGHEVNQSDPTFENFSAITCIGRRFYEPDVEYNQRVGGSSAIAHLKSDLNILLVILIGGLATSVVGLTLYEVLNPKVRKVMSVVTVIKPKQYDEPEQTEV